MDVNSVDSLLHFYPTLIAGPSWIRLRDFPEFHTGLRISSYLQEQLLLPVDVISSCGAAPRGVLHGPIKTRARIVNEYGGFAGEHIVRVDVGDGEVVHSLLAGEPANGVDGNLHPRSRSPQRLAGEEVAGVDPLLALRAPEGMVFGGVDQGGLAVGVLDREVGEFCVVV